MLKITLFNLLLLTYVSSTRLGDLSDVPHHSDSKVHDVTFDQQAFLGKEGLEEFSKLTPEQSKQRLRKLVEQRIDTNKDGKVSQAELRQWISYISKQWIIEERDRSWKDYNPENKPVLDFQTYSDTTYGERINERYSGEELKKTLQNIDLDKRKWELADKNHDGVLNSDEFLAFVRPEEDPKMKPFLIDELLIKSDINKDGYLDLNEYLDELYTREGDAKRGEIPEPEWIKSEREHFGIHRDKNNDGKMDRDEIGEWIMPSNYDGVEAETLHLMDHADKNKDGSLSMDEIMDQAEMFVSSQATNYGESLQKEEL